MKILWHMLGDRTKASSRVRGYWIAEELKKDGIESDIALGGRKRDLLRLAFRMRSFDAVVLQKQVSRWHVLLAKWGKMLGKTVILDIDDFPSRISNPRTLRNTGRVMQSCSAVIAGCENLRGFSEKFNSSTKLIPSCIKLENYPPSSSHPGDGTVTLGWIGNGNHYWQDLVNTLAVPLRTASASQSLRLCIVGACGRMELRDAFAGIPNLELELVDQIDWAAPDATAKALQGVDIGLYPLLENDFNRYKCGFKALEYMALELPVIASPVSATKGIVRDRESGRLCKTADEWSSAVTELAGNPLMRRELGAAGRARVEKCFSTKMAAAEMRRVIERSSDNRS